MAFSVYLTVSEVKAFRYLFNDRAAALVWFEKQLIAASKKKVRKDFSGEVVQTYDFTTEVPAQESDDMIENPMVTEMDAINDQPLGSEEPLPPIILDDGIPAQELTCYICGFEAKTGAGLASHERACKKVTEDIARLKAEDNAAGVGEDEDVSPPCPQPEVALPGELTRAIQDRPFAAIADCPFCDKEGALYDFVDPETQDVNRACVNCWIEVSK